jgi:chromosome segregation ATPase
MEELHISPAFQELHDPTRAELLAHVQALSEQVNSLTREIAKEKETSSRYRRERNRAEEREERVEDTLNEVMEDVRRHALRASTSDTQIENLQKRVETLKYEHGIAVSAADAAIEFLQKQVNTLRDLNHRHTVEASKREKKHTQQKARWKRELQRAQSQARTWENRWEALKARIPEFPERTSARLQTEVEVLEEDNSDVEL